MLLYLTGIGKFELVCLCSLIENKCCFTKQVLLVNEFSFYSGLLSSYLRKVLFHSLHFHIFSFFILRAFSLTTCTGQSTSLLIVFSLRLSESEGEKVWQKDDLESHHKESQTNRKGRLNCIVHTLPMRNFAKLI